jgi:hypothetical protein
VESARCARRDRIRCDAQLVSFCVDYIVSPKKRSTFSNSSTERLPITKSSDRRRASDSLNWVIPFLESLF